MGCRRQEAYAELDGDREEVDADLLLDRVTARNTREVDVAGLDEALGASASLEELLGEPRRRSVSTPKKERLVNAYL